MPLVTRINSIHPRQAWTLGSPVLSVKYIQLKRRKKEIVCVVNRCYMCSQSLRRFHIGWPRWTTVQCQESKSAQRSFAMPAPVPAPGIPVALYRADLVLVPTGLDFAPVRKGYSRGCVALHYHRLGRDRAAERPDRARGRGAQGNGG